MSWRVCKEDPTIIAQTHIARSEYHGLLESRKNIIGIPSPIQFAEQGNQVFLKTWFLIFRMFVHNVYTTSFLSLIPQQ